MIQNDKEVLLSIVDEISKAMTDAQSTKHWADNAVLFDIPSFASRGVAPAAKKMTELS